MGDNVIPITSFRAISDGRKPANPGNGAREALANALVGEIGCPEYESTADRILAALWIYGFKVVPLDPADEAP